MPLMPKSGIWQHKAMNKQGTLNDLNVFKKEDFFFIQSLLSVPFLQTKKEANRLHSVSS